MEIENIKKNLENKKQEKLCHIKEKIKIYPKKIDEIEKTYDSYNYEQIILNYNLLCSFEKDIIDFFNIEEDSEISLKKNIEFLNNKIIHLKQRLEIKIFENKIEHRIETIKQYIITINQNIVEDEKLKIDKKKLE